MTLKVGELFAGIGGFSAGLESGNKSQPTMSTQWFVEKDKYSRSIIRKHWPWANIYEDVKDVGKHNLDPVDILVGGFPCQDLSVANQNRKGLAGRRSGLWYEFERIIGELAPEWVVIENVTGLLSSNKGRDFGVILHSLAQRGFGVAYRVLDSQWFGVAQRRRRVVIVANRRDWTAPAKVLLEPESVLRDTPPSRKAWEEVAGDIKNCPNCGSELGVVDWIPDVSYAVNGQGSKFGSGRFNQDTFIVQHFPDGDVTHTVVPNQVRYSMTDNLIVGEVQAVDVRNMRIQPDGVSGTLQSKNTGGFSLNYQNPVLIGTCPNCGIHSDKDVVAFQQNQRNELRLINDDGQIAGALVAHAGMKNQNYLASHYIVRKLSPVECERLQGFPDTHTQFGVRDDGKEIEISDTRRYTMLGNAVTTNVMAWVGNRIRKYVRGEL